MSKSVGNQVLQLIRNLCSQDLSLSINLKDDLDKINYVQDDEAFSFLEKSLDNAKLVSSTPKKWDFGWSENNQLYIKSKDYNKLAPLYTGKLPYIRLNRRLYGVEIRASEDQTCNSLEHRLFSFLYDSVITDRVIRHCKEKNVKSITLIEVGSGSCQHIPRINKILKSNNIDVHFIATDWSKSTGDICQNLQKIDGIDVDYYQLDMLDTEKTINFPENSIIYTINSLEQLGERFRNIYNIIYKSSPALVIHFEPIVEVLDRNNSYDLFSIKYMKKRDYLNGYLSHLITQESMQNLKIKAIKRTFLGNAHHENNTLIEWFPLRSTE